MSGPSATLSALADVGAEERAGSFQDAASDERNWQSDEEDGDTEKQREPGRPKQRHEFRVGMFVPRERRRTRR